MLCARLDWTSGAEEGHTLPPSPLTPPPPPLLHAYPPPLPQDLECPICYDVLHHPIALRCGHSLCMLCTRRLCCAAGMAEAAAKGWGPNALTRSSALRRGARLAACPLCRGGSILEGARLLPWLDALAKRRLLSAWVTKDKECRDWEAFVQSEGT